MIRLYLSENQIVWFVYHENMTRFIPRIDQEGNILQIISSGSKNLNSVDLISYLVLLSETEFMMSQFAWLQYNFLSIKFGSLWDASIVRMTTEPKVVYNLMMDYNNYFDGPIMIRVFNNTCYLLWTSSVQFVALTYFPLDKNQIDIPTLK